MGLALKYRPKTFDDVIGQGLTPVVLSAMVERDEVPDGFLFTGPSGTGKTSAARILGAALGADVWELDGATNGNVASIRSLTESLKYGATRRLVILDEAHAISREGMNALLKSIEEPYPGVVFVLITTEPKKIPNTVATRLTDFEFRRVDTATVLSLLVNVAAKEGMDFESHELLMLLAKRSQGSPRRALTMLDQCRLSGITDPTEFLRLQGIFDTAPLLIAALATGDPARSDEVLSDQLMTSRTPQSIVDGLISCLRDIQVLRSQGKIEATDDALQVRSTLAASINPEQAFAALNVLWQYRTNLSTSDDPANDLRLACALLEKHLYVGREIL